MLSSLLRPKKARPHVEEHSPFASPYPERRNAADWTEDDGEDENTEDEDDLEEGEDEEDSDNEEVIEEEDGEDEDTPLLPLFSAAHLGKGLCHCSAYNISSLHCTGSLGTLKFLSMFRDFLVQ
jgi:hypothetical protein